jgi:hypothetical protein
MDAAGVQNGLMDLKQCRLRSTFNCLVKSKINIELGMGQYGGLQRGIWLSRYGGLVVDVSEE